MKNTVKEGYFCTAVVRFSPALLLVIMAASGCDQGKKKSGAVDLEPPAPLVDGTSYQLVDPSVAKKS